MKAKLLLMSAMRIALPAFCQNDDALQELSAEFWTWRATTQPFNLDDIPRSLVGIIPQLSNLADGENLEKTTHAGGFNAFPQFSPDGKK